MIWLILALGMITAAPIILFALASLSCEFGLIPVVTAGFIGIAAFSALPPIIAACTTLIVLAVLIVCRQCVDNGDIEATTRGGEL